MMTSRLHDTRYLITSALPYISGVKHLGNLVGSMLPADVYARYLRARGREVLYICGTDEHGTPAEIAAIEAGEDVAAFCAKMHALQARLCREFGIAFDHFGRSSSQQNRELTQAFAASLDARGLLEERVVSQVYSIDDRRFLPDRYVIGTCPNCGYEAARGDQCENCTKLLDPTDLIDPRSAISGSTNIEVRQTKHLFLLQSKLVGRLRAWIDSHGEWPTLVRSIANKWLDEGLRDRAITRDLNWGVPVDRPGFEHKVFYVWFDAPIEYIGSTKEWADLEPGKRDWRSWWYEARDVRYVQFMAKDNIPFHTISFPCTIIGSDEPWKLVDYIKGFNWLTYYGGKFSTSGHRGVFMSDALELLPADYWRFYLIYNAPENNDAAFTWENFGEVVNKELADNLGNFVSRVTKFSLKHFSGRAGPIEGEGDAERELFRDLDASIARLNDNFETMQFRKAAQELKQIWSLGNIYLDRAAPWKIVATDPAGARRAIAVAVGLIRIYALLSRPILPFASDRMLAQLGISSAPEAWVEASSAAEVRKTERVALSDGADILFQKVLPEQLEAWAERFSGSERSSSRVG